MLDCHCPRDSASVYGNLPCTCFLIEIRTYDRGRGPNIQVESRCVRFEPVTQLRTVRDYTDRWIEITLYAGQ